MENQQSGYESYWTEVGMVPAFLQRLFLIGKTHRRLIAGRGLYAPHVKHLWLSWAVFNFLEKKGSCPRCWEYSELHHEELYVCISITPNLTMDLRFVSPLPTASPWKTSGLYLQHHQVWYALRSGQYKHNHSHWSFKKNLLFELSNSSVMLELPFHQNSWNINVAASPWRLSIGCR